MADFVQTMKDWRRMCNACQTEKDISGVCGCYPAGNYATCAMKSMDKEADLACDDLYFERLEKTIEVWAAEHPEPVYPTWYAWLANMCVVPIELPPDQAIMVTDIGLLKKIPADIAERLGIKPKEGT